MSKCAQPCRSCRIQILARAPNPIIVLGSSPNGNIGNQIASGVQSYPRGQDLRWVLLVVFGILLAHISKRWGALGITLLSRRRRPFQNNNHYKTDAESRAQSPLPHHEDGNGIKSMAEASGAATFLTSLPVQTQQHRTVPLPTRLLALLVRSRSPLCVAYCCFFHDGNHIVRYRQRCRRGSIHFTWIHPTSMAKATSIR